MLPIDDYMVAPLILKNTNNSQILPFNQVKLPIS